MEIKKQVLNCSNVLFAHTDTPADMEKLPSVIFDFKLNGFGYLKPKDIYLEINEIEAFKKIEVFYQDSPIARKIYGFKNIKIYQEENIYRLSDIFPGLKFNVFNSYKLPFMIRFSRNDKVYENWKPIKIGYYVNFDEPVDITKYREELIAIKNKRAYYNISNYQEATLIYFVENEKIIPSEERSHTIYYNDMKLEQPYKPEYYSMAGSHYIDFENNDFNFDYLFIIHIGKFSYKEFNKC